MMISESSGQIYRINGRCEGEDGKPCKGHQFNHGICYHRALKRLRWKSIARFAGLGVGIVPKHHTGFV